MLRLLVLPFVVACFIQALYAAPAGVAATPELEQCTAIANPTERLKCYDAAADRQRFGQPPPREPVTQPEVFGKPPPPRLPEIREISATLVEFARTPRGRAIFVLDNGQTWRQLDADSVRVDDPRPGESMKVIIERGWLDSYNLTLSGRNPSIKVRRVQ